MLLLSIKSVRGVAYIQVKEKPVASSIQNIVAILNSYTNGKLFVSKKGKHGGRSIVNDLVSISDEARERVENDGSKNRGDGTEDAVEN
jgi:hypothetical protein